MDDAQLIVTILGINATGILVLLAGLYKALESGKLVTQRENDATVADRNMWRETAQTLTPVVSKVLDQSETTNRLLRALPGIPEDGHA